MIHESTFIRNNEKTQKTVRTGEYREGEREKEKYPVTALYTEKIQMNYLQNRKRLKDLEKELRLPEGERVGGRDSQVVWMDMPLYTHCCI